MVLHEHCPLLELTPAGIELADACFLEQCPPLELITAGAEVADTNLLPQRDFNGCGIISEQHSQHDKFN